MKAVLSLLLLVSALVVRGTEEGVLRFWWNRGDVVLSLYDGGGNPGWSDGVWSSSGLGAHYAWHKQELWKGRAAWYAGIGRRAGRAGASNRDCSGCAHGLLLMRTLGTIPDFSREMPFVFD